MLISIILMIVAFSLTFSNVVVVKGSIIDIPEGQKNTAEIENLDQFLTYEDPDGKFHISHTYKNWQLLWE